MRMRIGYIGLNGMEMSAGQGMMEHLPENINRASFVDSLFAYESYLFLGNRGTGYNPVTYTLRNGTNGVELYNGLDLRNT